MARTRTGYAAAAVVVATLVVVGLAMLDGAAHAAPAGNEIEWVFDHVSANRSEANPLEVVNRTDVGFRRFIADEPTAEFTVDFAEMMIDSAAPGATHTFTVDVEGRIAPGADTTVQGFRVTDAILIVAGRWDGRTAVGVGVNCVNDIFGQPLGCTPEAGSFTGASATFSVDFPAIAAENDLFAFGVGALNCPQCFVEYVFRAQQAQPAPRCDGRRATIGPDARTSNGRILGTPRADVIVGSPLADIIEGRGGNDIICGAGGGDDIDGGPGADRVLGGNGADAVTGGRGPDHLRGGRGNDIIRGGAGVDTANGQAGRDRCAAERETSCEKDPRIAGPRVSWTMPDRYGQAGANGVVYPTRVVDPGHFRVDFELRRGNGRRCSRSDSVAVRSPKGTFRVTDHTKPCTIRGRFAEGSHRVRFTLTTDEGKGRTRVEVVVQDWLVVGIGDSNGSGEGTPDKPRGSAATWVDEQCHRSANSHQALVAAGLENADDRTSVTFRHLSCSGAQIATGLLRPYRGIIEGKLLRPQLPALRDIARRREVDAVLMSAGVNDLHFGEMVEFCVKWRDCPNTVWETFGDETLQQVMTRFLNGLPTLYGRINRRLTSAGIPADRVYLTEYFDSTRDQNGVVCDPLIRLGSDDYSRDFDQAEATWAAEQVLQPLNRLARKAANRYGWNFVSGAEAGFARHGYCAGAQRWIVTRAQSKANQGDQNGTLHSTREGNVFQRNQVLPAVVEDFYGSDARPRPPTASW